MANVALIAPLLGARWWAPPGAYPAVGDDVCPVPAVLAAISSLRPAAAGDAGDGDAAGAASVGERAGPRLSAGAEEPALVAGALATGFRQPAAAGGIAQSPVIIISGEQATSYEYGMLQVPIFGALIAGNRVLARLTRARRTVRSLDYSWGGLVDHVWPDPSCGGRDRGLFPRLSVDDGRSELLRLPGLACANAGLVRLTLFASEMSTRHGLGGDGNAADADLHRRHRAQQTCLRAGGNGLFVACLTCWVGYYGWG